MKFLLLAALVSVAVALPHKGLVVPGAAGPAPVIIDEFEPVAIGPAIINEFEPIAVGPAVIDEFEPISIGPAIVEGQEPISVGPAIVEGQEPISVGPEIIDFPVPSPVISNPPAPTPPSASAPLVQIILNINQEAAFPEIKPEPVQVVEVAPTPVEPIDIGTPILPSPVVILPEELN